jgi:hypothetical protein
MLLVDGQWPGTLVPIGLLIPMVYLSAEHSLVITFVIVISLDGKTLRKYSCKSHIVFVFLDPPLSWPQDPQYSINVGGGIKTKTTNLILL